jgi:hypothetical protein
VHAHNDGRGGSRHALAARDVSTLTASRQGCV